METDDSTQMHDDATMKEITHLADLLRGRKVVVLTGAGCSTESGIPDYRGPETRRRARNPVQYREFMDNPLARQRYWARSVLGWPRIANARPNGAHVALATLERRGAVAGVITQNVDRLHHAAGSTRVVELHGTVTEVRCCGCGTRASRAALQGQLLAMNPEWHGAHRQPVEPAPDGDAELSDRATTSFRLVDCHACRGVLKPNVVFFGESVPRGVVDQGWRLLDETNALLVVGSSLAVFSGYRFVRKAAERSMPIAIINLGPTRGDPHAHMRIHGRAGRVLPALARLLYSDTVPDEPR